MGFAPLYKLLILRQIYYLHDTRDTSRRQRDPKQKMPPNREVELISKVSYLLDCDIMKGKFLFKKIKLYGADRNRN